VFSQSAGKTNNQLQSALGVQAPAAKAHGNYKAGYWRNINAGIGLACKHQQIHGTVYTNGIQLQG
jgi:hypothetical protein